MPTFPCSWRPAAALFKLDPSTYQLPFEADSTIDRIYLIAPPVLDMFPPMKAFIDVAIEKGGIQQWGKCTNISTPAKWSTALYVHLGSSVHNLLLHYSDNIRKNNEIVNAAGSGAIGWISTDDIADVAFKALTDPVIAHTNPIMVGPELFTYAQIAEITSEVLGRKITHKNVSADEFTAVMVARGMPEDYAAVMSFMDVRIAAGAEEQSFKKADFVGSRSLREFIERHKDAQEWKSGM
ncbi:hypothetical protein C8R45DRAFT_1112989 [Mycena sanguinolenta]|nr:hypothetical protein C8R45DRAFT_1112989 [Mycena sanguinolenta]